MKKLFLLGALRAMIIFDKPIATPASCIHQAFNNAFAIDTSTNGETWAYGVSN